MRLWPILFFLIVSLLLSCQQSEKSKTNSRIIIKLSHVLVDDQEKALQFYTKMLGFEKKEDVPLGPYRWLTVTSPAGVHGVELLLEPNAYPAAKEFQQALYKDGIPAAVFFVDDIQKEYERLTKLGVTFKSPPVKTDQGLTIAIFDDTCGNWVQLVQEK